MVLVMLLGLLVLPVVATAGDYICGDPTKLQRFTPSADATRVPTCPAPFVLSPLPDDQAILTAQRTLYTTVGLKYLKVPDATPRLMVEMTQAEKDAVDLPGNIAAAAVAEAQQEQATQEYCATKTLEQISTKVTNKTNQIHANVDAITNLQTGKDADKLNFDIVMGLIEQLARCIRAVRTTR